MKYRYNGTEELHLPTHKVTVNTGDTVETEEVINHPDFEEVKKNKKEEVEN